MAEKELNRGGGYGGDDLRRLIEGIGITPKGVTPEATDVALVPASFAGKFAVNKGLEANPAYLAWLSDVKRVWGLPIAPPEQLRWGRIEAYSTIPPGMSFPIPFKGDLGSAVADLRSEYAVSVHVRGDEKAGFGGEGVDVPIMAATKPVDLKILDEYKVDTVVGEKEERKLQQPLSLKDIMRKLGVETYEDVIHLFVFVPISNEKVRGPEQRYRTQFEFNLTLNRAAEFYLLQGRKAYDTALLRESSGRLPYPNPVNRRLFEAAYSGDSADLIGVPPDSGTFVFIAKPIKEKGFYKIITDGFLPEPPTRDALTMGGGLKGVTEIGGVRVHDGSHSGHNYSQAEETVRDEDRKPRVIMVTVLGVREGAETALATAVNKADEKLIIPIQLRKG